MRSAGTIQSEIIERFGYFPPVFEPALQTPAILENLWHQTLFGYLENPLPPLFKEKLVVLFARSCFTSYCLFVHVSKLRTLGMSASEILDFLEQPVLTVGEFKEKTGFSELYRAPWPALDSLREDFILCCSLSIFLNEDLRECHEQLRKILIEADYAHLVVLIGFFRVILDWTDAYPHLDPEADQGVQENLPFLLQEEPRLEDLLFRNLNERQLPAYSLVTRQFEDFIMQAPIPMVLLLGPEHRFTIVNQPYHDLVGRQVLGKSVTEAFAREEVESFLPLLDEVFQTGRPYLGKARPLDLTGARPSRFINVSFYPFRQSSGRIQGILVFLQDVTEDVVSKKRLEESSLKLVEAQEQLTFALKSARMGTWLIDLKNNKVTVSPAAAEIFGLMHGKLDLSQVIQQSVHPEDFERVQKVWLDAIKNQKVYNQEYRIIHPNGAIRWIFSTGAVKAGLDGKPAYVSGVLGDISERKEIELKLATQTQRLEAIFNNSPAAMALWKGPDFVFEWVNSEYQSFFVGNLLIGKTFSEVFSEIKGQSILNLLTHVYETGEPFVGSEMLTKFKRSPDRESESRYYDFTYVRIMDGAGSPYGIYCHALDVTDRVLTRREIEKSREDLALAVEGLKEERELRERFVATLTHDLRTPMTATRMAGQLFNLKSLPPEQMKVISERVVANMDRAEAMIRDLLDASRIKAGQGVSVSVHSCRLDLLAKTVIDELTPVYGARFSLNNQAGEIQGYWDKSAVQRILENLISNAVKYGMVNTPIEIRLIDGQGFVELAVHNQGNAITPEDQKTLFNAYRRTESARKSGQKGWGIGLTLVKGFTEAHQGSVRVESDPVNGTTFFVRLPLDARAAAA